MAANISQFDGYEALAEFDWAGHRARYGNIGRLDLILEAEGDSTNRYRLSKQADVLMLIYLLGLDGLIDMLGGLGYDVTPEDLAQTVDHYLAGTCRSACGRCDSWSTTAASGSRSRSSAERLRFAVHPCSVPGVRVRAGTRTIRLEGGKTRTVALSGKR